MTKALVMWTLVNHASDEPPETPFVWRMTPYVWFNARSQVRYRRRRDAIERRRQREARRAR